MGKNFTTISLKPETKQRLIKTLNLKTFDEAINTLLDIYENAKEK